MPKRAADLLPPPRRPWTRDRIARLGFLVGQGHDAEIVARDPEIGCSPGNVRHQANRFGLMLRKPREKPRLPRDVCARLDAAADHRGLTRERLIRNLVVAAGSDDALLANILDDEG